MSKQVEYILFTGTQCIDTGFKPNGNTTVEIEFSLNSDVTDNRAVLGARTSASGSDSTSFTIWTIDSTKIRFDHYGTSNTITNYNPKEKHICKMTPTEEIIDGTVLKTHSQLSNTSPVNLTLGKANTKNVDNYYGKCKIYSCKIYNGETLVRNFVPYKDDNKKFCMKDLVYNTLYYSATTSDLNGPFDPKDVKTGSILNFDYTGAVQAITLPKGIYKLECWGAQGGYSSSNSGIEVGMGGKGGYSVGTITLDKKTPIYIYTGGVGNISGNGKADGGFPNGGSSWASDTSEGAGGGGGSSDIRIGTDSLHARVIVAGGGGGGGEDNETGGYGGGETGGASGSGTPGSQTAPSGYFGIGGHTSYDGGGGGGGWYGACPAGGQTTPATSNSGSDTSGSPGGSGYVYTSSTAKNYPSGCLLNSSYYLTDAKTVAGNTSFKSPSGSSETGHSKNGYCRITVIKCNNIAIYGKLNGSMKKAIGFYFKLNNKIHDVSKFSTTDIMDFNYTGSVQSVTLKAGSYQLECWGAQGGYRSSSSYGGKGGYSIGTLVLTSTTTLYIYVGGSGNSVKSATNSIYPGGFNGGGRRYKYKGGGGATDIRIKKDSLYARVIVAGGGGSDGASSKTGMYGGGTTGGSSTENYGSGGYGGTQTGNTWSTSTQATSATSKSNCYAGFGFGGNGCYYSAGYAGAGGGGWYGGSGSYPDGSGDDDRGGGGGSGYIYTSSTAKNYPQGCLLNSSYYLTDAQTIAGNQAFTSPEGTSETGHSGNGFCRITNMTPKQYGMFIKRNGTWTHIDL